MCLHRSHQLRRDWMHSLRLLWYRRKFCLHRKRLHRRWNIFWWQQRSCNSLSRYSRWFDRRMVRIVHRGTCPHLHLYWNVPKPILRMVCVTFSMMRRIKAAGSLSKAAATARQPRREPAQNGGQQHEQQHAARPPQRVFRCRHQQWLPGVHQFEDEALKRPPRRRHKKLEPTGTRGRPAAC